MIGLPQPAQQMGQGQHLQLKGQAGGPHLEESLLAAKIFRSNNRESKTLWGLAQMWGPTAVRPRRAQKQKRALDRHNSTSNEEPVPSTVPWSTSSSTPGSSILLTATRTSFRTMLKTLSLAELRIRKSAHVRNIKDCNKRTCKRSS